MKNNEQNGFSLIELLLVVVIIGVIASIAFPLLYRAKESAANNNAFASMRTVFSAQVSYSSNNGRFARLDELNTAQANGLGTISGTDLIRGKFTFQMSPVAPTDAELRNGFTIIATKATGSDLPYVLTLTQSGYIVEAFGP